MTQRQQNLLVGTDKGLVIYEARAGRWVNTSVQFLGLPVSVVFVDERTDTWWVCLAHRHWGQKIHRSHNRGKSWQQVATPRYPEGAQLKSGKPATLRRIWTMAHAGEDRPAELYLGTEPGGLFHSTDGGDTFRLVESLWNHPSRQDEWFGAGRDHPFIHSIVVDPRDSDHFYIAVSCAGVFETRDSGKTWAVRNQGLIAAYLPNPQAEIGHDPHRLLLCPADPDVLWQQNHCGIFRSTDGGKQWTDISGEEGFPSYGFTIVADEKDSLTAWVAPAVSDEIRVAVDRALCICRTDDGGQSWRALRTGLPQENCFDIVFRDAMDISQDSLVLGSTTGNLYFSPDRGNNWTSISHHLARINCVIFA
ncbi:MAG: sialidase family protein [Saprospiraceae bacterium]|nr:sialidase family protein [Saprospiraceae bacterium]